MIGVFSIKAGAEIVGVCGTVAMIVSGFLGSCLMISGWCVSEEKVEAVVAAIVPIVEVRGVSFLIEMMASLIGAEAGVMLAVLWAVLFDVARVFTTAGCEAASGGVLSAIKAGSKSACFGWLIGRRMAVLTLETAAGLTGSGEGLT